MADVPEVVECPCGTGYAEHRRTTVSDPNGRIRRKEVHHYRHEGCDLGGHIVERNGTILGRGGPLFDIARFDVAAANPTRQSVVTDGGTTQ